MTSPAHRSSFRPDVGLQARMLLTMLLLGLVYIAFVVVLFSAGASVVTMAPIVCGLALAQLLLSDKLALRAMGARVVSVQDAPELHALVERLCIEADMPKPRLALADTPTPNAFAIVARPRTPSRAPPPGLLDVLEPHELDGVLAHELSHIQNRNVLVMTLASFFATVASLIAQIGLVVSPGGSNRDGQPALVVIVAVSFALYVISYVLMLALSRYREFAADRGAALVTGDAPQRWLRR